MADINEHRAGSNIVSRSTKFSWQHGNRPRTRTVGKKGVGPIKNGPKIFGRLFSTLCTFIFSKNLHRTYGYRTNFQEQPGLG